MIVVITEYQRREILRCGSGNSEKIEKILRFKEENDLLVKVNRVLQKKYDLHIGQNVVVYKSYIDQERNIRNTVSIDMLNCPKDEFWFFYMAGYDTGKKHFVVARYYRDSKIANHYTLPSMKFVKTLEENKEFLKTNFRKWKKENVSKIKEVNFDTIRQNTETDIPVSEKRKKIFKRRK